MFEMLKRPAGLVFAVMLATLSAIAELPQYAMADDSPEPSVYGTYLGRTIACSCVSAEQDFAMHVYDALLTKRFGATFANQAQDHMRLALREADDNQTMICGVTCDNEAIPFLQQVLDTTAQSMSVAATLTSNDAASFSHSTEALPPCSATEDLISGVQCEGRQKGRVNGY